MREVGKGHESASSPGWMGSDVVIVGNAPTEMPLPLCGSAIIAAKRWD